MFLDETVCDFCQIDIVAIQNLLSSSILNTTRETSPGSSSKNSVGHSFPFGSKTNYLLENTFPFLVYRTTRLKHNRSKVVVRLLKRGGVTISLLGLGIRLTWFRRVEV